MISKAFIVHGDHGVCLQVSKSLHRDSRIGFEKQSRRNSIGNEKLIGVYSRPGSVGQCRMNEFNGYREFALHGGRLATCFC